MMRYRSLALHTLGIIAVSLLALYAIRRFAATSAVRFEGSVQNVFYRLRGAHPADPRLVLVAIDDDSIARIGSWPWRRDVHARLIDRLTALGAQTIALDIIFMEPSRFPDADRALVEATRRSGRVIHAMMISSSRQGSERYDPLESIAKAAAGLGDVSLRSIEPDGTIRVLPAKRPYRTKDGEKTGYALAAVAAAHFLKKNPEEVAASLPDSFDLNYFGPWNGRSVKTISVFRVLGDELQPEERAALRGGLVMVGSTSRKAFDHFPSPFGGQIPGALANLALADNVLSSRPLRSHDPMKVLPFFAVPAALVLLGLAGWSAAAFLLGIVGAALACFLVDWLAFLACHNLSPAAVLIAFLAALIWAAVVRRFRNP